MCEKIGLQCKHGLLHVETTVNECTSIINFVCELMNAGRVLEASCYGEKVNNGNCIFL